ncbi:MAG: hypothetical protein R2715_12265 [Ilumatobacteraceae bacterium]
MSTEYGTNQGALLVSVSGPTPVVRVSRMAPGLPTGQLNLLSTPAYVLGAIWALALVVGRANSLQGSRIGTEFLRFARPTVSAMAVMFQSAWPGLPGLSLPTQLALLVALVASISLAVTARLTQGRAYVVLLGLAGLSALALGVAAVGLAVSGLPFSEVGAGLVVQVTLVVALSNAAWRLQRQLVLSDIDVTSFTAASEPRGIDRVASAMFFCFAASIIPPVWIGRRILGSALIPVAMAAPDSAANQLFNSASPWFYAYGLALGSIVYAAILLVPPYQRRGRLVALGCVLGVIAVGPGLTTFAEQARAASQNIVQQIQAAPMTADQLGWVCSTWTAPDTPGQLYVWSGDACRTLSVYEGQVKRSEVQVQRDLYTDTAVSAFGSNSFNAGTGFLHGVYDAGYIAVGESPSSPGGHVLAAYDLATMTEQWSFTCPQGAPSFGVRFSGSHDGDEPASNRETLEMSGLMEYVAVDCGAGLQYLVTPDGELVNG